MSEEPATSLRSRQRERVHDDIQRGALKLFADHGYESVTTDEIARAAGVSLSTYFRHVRNKEDLLLSAVRQGGAAIVTHLETRPAAEPAEVALTEAILTRTSAFSEAAESVTHWRAAIVQVPELLDRVSLIDRRERDRLSTLVAQRMGSGNAGAQQAGLLVHVLLAAAEYAFQQWLTGPVHDLAQLYELVRNALETVQRGQW